jgi:protein-tyrosine phosphatase
VVSSSVHHPPSSQRRLVWEGCYNVRDLGGHQTAGGPLTRWGAVVRSDACERLTDAGWSALHRHGITTIIDLRDPAERKRDVQPSGVDLIALPLLDFSDDAFWGEGRWRGNDHSTAFYLAVLERWPERLAAAIESVVRARPGGVLIHCQAGRDRTGLLSAALLALVGVAPESIAHDYAESKPSLQPLYDQWLAKAHDEPERERIRRANVCDAAVMLEVLDSIDLPALLLRNGLPEAALTGLQQRLVT